MYRCVELGNPANSFISASVIAPSAGLFLAPMIVTHPAREVGPILRHDG
jgi:hypothetical protein